MSGFPVAAVTITETVTETVHATPEDEGGYGAKVFDEAALEGENGVKKILVENYNEPYEDIWSVDCPPDQEVVQGSSFQCVVVIRGDHQTVKITVVNDDGQYEVATPEGS